MNSSGNAIDDFSAIRGIGPIREKWLRKFLEESHFNPPGRIIKEYDDVLYELQIVIKPDFINWVLSMIPYMVPVKPKQLVEQVRERLREGLGILS